jgi:putative inorganic carbon (HCO3(-)) transporter
VHGTRLTQPALVAGSAGATALAGVAVALRAGVADGYLAFAVLAALVAGAVLVTTVEPAVTLCAGLALGVFSGQFGQLGSPIGLDRVVLVAGIAATIVHELRSDAPRLRVRGLHLVLLGLLVYAGTSALFARTLTSNEPFFALLDYLGVIPFALFFVAPAAFPTPRERGMLLRTLVVVGLYLGVTAIFETVGPRSLVFPRYIMDPGVGIHFGRARGPFVEAAGDGLAMFFCAVAAAVALVQLRGKLLPSLSLAACAVGIVFTLTRQVWLAAALATVLTLALRRPLRPWLIPGAVAGAVAVLAIFAFVPGFSGRAHDRLNDQSPVWDRLNSDAATLRMMGERPALGFGWYTFAQRGDPYYRLAADRPLSTVGRPHNVFLAYGAEIGVPATLVWIGTLLFAVGGALLKRGPPDLDAWRSGLLAVFVAWIVVANFTPMGYAFDHALLWLLAGLCWSRT